MDYTTRPPAFPRPHNDGVDCHPGLRKFQECNGCGWNPEVAKARLAQYYRENNIMPIMNSAGKK